ncbi:MAG: tRNA preQ1(34) S-adenosylmethionine ribosyltransferase-isomerase QueA [Myxococcota bacterium]
MRIEDFDFELPVERIAQRPLPARDASRLMVVERSTGERAHRRFCELPSLLRPQDLLVVNDSRVIPARLLGKKEGSGGKVELLLVRPAGDSPTSVALEAAQESEWICLGQASKGLKAGTRVGLSGMRAEILEHRGEGEYRVRFVADAPRFADALARSGRLPLPPYIRREPSAEDAERYQTVYARSPGSVAAPTAGLHFTSEVLAALETKGVRRAAVTLEVGPGTFLPVRDGNLDAHRMHAERFEIPPATSEAIARTRAEGGRVVAVGTTVVRALESAAIDGGEARFGTGETALFIRPGFRFRVVDALLTNFHLPRSTLLVLVSAFLGREKTLEAYRAAIEEGYRFFSYGDAMLIGDFR